MHIRATSTSWTAERAAGANSDVAFEDARLGESRQAFADCSGSCVAHAVDGLKVVDAGREQPLQGAEVLDQPLDHRAGSRGTLASSR